jgi:predicted DNA-binding transcriptional regulator AlpA
MLAETNEQRKAAMDADSDKEPRRLVPIPEARHLLGDIGHTTVYELIKRGEIVKVNIGRRGFITSESLEAYMDRLSEAATA